MGGLTSFFGGVVSKLTHEESGEYYDETEGSGDDPEASGDDPEASLDQSNEDGPVAAARTALGFLSTVAGGAGRPPFVMNTAVSDDDEDEDAGTTEDDGDEDEDSEVELGWDDDDDEDFDGLDDDDDEITDEIAFRDGDDRSETVDFKDAEKEGLLEELEQAREERDALQKTVQMQAEELKKVAAAAAAAQLAESSGGEGKDSSESLGDANTQSLKLQLFEKDAELAALRSKLDDRHDDYGEEDEGGTDASAALRATVDKLKEALAGKDHEFDALKQATQAQTRALEQKIEEQSNQQEELETLKGTVSAREKELSDLLKNRDDEASKLQHKVEEKQAEKEEMILALQSQIYALERQLEEKAPPPVSDQSVDDDEAEELREALASKDAEIAILRTKATEAASQTSDLLTKLSAKTEELESEASATQTAIAQLERQLVDETKLKESLGAEVEGLQMELVAVKDEAKQALQTATDQHSATVGELQSKLTAMSNDLSASLEEAASTKQETEALRKELEEYNRPPAIQPLRAPTSPLSSDSGVRVDVADAGEAIATIRQPPPAMPNTPSAAVSLGLEPSEHDNDGADDNDDDGWGDDW
jgi:chromosome segregation ATPase